MSIAPDVVITITMSPQGQLNVMGPLENKVLMYGLLTLAMDAIRGHNPEASKLLRPPLGGIPGLKGAN